MTEDLKRRFQKSVQKPVSRDVDEEISFHLEMRQRELVELGMSEKEAKQEAERLFGSQEDVAAECRRQTRGTRRLEERSWRLQRLGQDLRHGLRRLRREPAFTLAAALTLALGIGANTAIFSVLDGVLLKPLPFPESKRLVALWEVNEQGREVAVANDNFEDWRAQAQRFASMTHYSNWGGVTVTGDFDARTARRTHVSADYFDTLGVEPRRGRFFGSEDHQLGAPPTIVVSDGFWRGVLGERSLEDLSLRLDGEVFQVVGVVPAGLEYPENSEIWTPMGLVEDPSDRTAHNHRALARLPDGPVDAALEAAGAEMSSIAARLATEYAGEIDAVDVSVRPLHDQLVAGSRRPLWLLLGASGVLLLVACANLAGSLLAKSFARQREIAVRAALGAGQGGLFQQLIVESLLLALLGCALGLALAAALVRGLLVLAPPNLPRLDEVGLDVRVLVFTSLVGVVTGVALGVIPGWSLARRPLRSAISGHGKAQGRHPLWNALVATEIALALVLLVGAGLLLGSVRKILSAPLGFEPRGVVAATLEIPVDMPEWGDDLTPLLEAEQIVGTFANRLLDDVRALPGVEQAALVGDLPFRGLSSTTVFMNDRSEEDAGSAGYLLVSPDYFEVLGIPLLVGRTFSRTDVTSGEHVAVVSQAMAERYWPEGDAIGQLIRPPGMDLHGETWLRVVGIVGDVRQVAATRQAGSIMYVSLDQRPGGAKWSSVVARTHLDAAALAPTLRQAAKELSPDMPIAISTLEGLLHSSISRQRFQMLTMTAFAGLGLLLAAGGVWAVVAFQVAERTPEIGVRMALGASPRRVVRQLLGQTFRVVAVGSLLGLVASLAVTRSMESLLYEVEPGDPWILVLMTALLAAVGVAASWLPALRATRIDPVASLRAD